MDRAVPIYGSIFAMISVVGAKLIDKSSNAKAV